MRMEQMYQEVILDHYKHPHHRGLREPFGAEVSHVNPTCGDEVTLRVALSEDGERVTDVSYDGQGCSISQAATSVLTKGAENAALLRSRRTSGSMMRFTVRRRGPPSSPLRTSTPGPIARQARSITARRGSVTPTG